MWTYERQVVEIWLNVCYLRIISDVNFPAGIPAPPTGSRDIPGADEMHLRWTSKGAHRTGTTWAAFLRSSGSTPSTFFIGHVSFRAPFHFSSFGVFLLSCSRNSSSPSGRNPLGRVGVGGTHLLPPLQVHRLSAAPCWRRTTLSPSQIRILSHHSCVSFLWPIQQVLLTLNAAAASVSTAFNLPKITSHTHNYTPDINTTGKHLMFLWRLHPPVCVSDWLLWVMTHCPCCLCGTPAGIRGLLWLVGAGGGQSSKSPQMGWWGLSSFCSFHFK